MRVAISLFLIVLCNTVSAQMKCGTVELQEMMYGESLEDKSLEFENWLSKKMVEQETVDPINARTLEVFTIPVVIHVIHNGEPLGVGTNIPDEQIFSQMETLNQDFRRLNPDAIETPSEFLPVAADTQIEFVLARRDPEGLPTTGIIRQQGPRNVYSLFNSDLLKAQSFWPSEDYLNIWVANLGNELLGFAQFPISNEEGLNIENNNDRLTDGLVVTWDFFGTGFNTDPISQGRTATHEIGHFFGLRHVWGDGGCTRDDFCSDTPFMADNSFGCPASQVSCGSNDMFQNYMDFSNDDCMNLFTLCQSSRMRTVLQESPRRRSLLVSPGATDAIQVPNDLGVRNILSPEVSVCATEISPEIELRNYGTNNIDNFTIDFFIDGELVESSFQERTIAPLGITTVLYQSITVNEGEEFDIEFRVSQVNGGNDGNSENDRKSLFVQVPHQASLPLSADFENGNDQWMVRNFDGSRSDWERVNAPLTTLDNTAFAQDFFTSGTENFGNLDMLLSPVIDLSKVSSSEIIFQYAYAPFEDNISDGLRVAVLTECGVSFDVDNVLTDFDLVGSELGTTTTTSDEFIPSGSSDWQEVTLNLNAFLGLEEVQIALIAQNGGGNNLYVDDVRIDAGDPFQLDAKVTSISELPEISCRTFQAPIVEVKNFGIQTITSIDYLYGVTGGQVQQGRLENITVPPGSSQSIAVGVSDLSEGIFEFGFNVIALNDQADEDPEDNILTQFFRITQQEDILPLRELFEQRTLAELNWFQFSPTGLSDWSFNSITTEVETSQTISIEAFNLLDIGKKNWLVSPKLDLSTISEASLRFDLSYAQRLNFADKLDILVSTDCGRSFGNLVYSKQGADLAVTNFDNAWIPQSTNDWVSESVDLSQFAGSSDVLVAFVFTNANGNNIYLDNFDFFLTSEPSNFELADDVVRVFPNPAPDDFNVTFNLLEKETVSFRLIDMMGHEIITQEVPNVLNQTLSVETANLRSGMYLLQMIGDSFRQTERVVVIR